MQVLLQGLLFLYVVPCMGENCPAHHFKKASFLITTENHVILFSNKSMCWKWWHLLSFWIPNHNPQGRKKTQQLVWLYKSLQEVIPSRSTGFCAIFITGKHCQEDSCVCLAGGASPPSPLTPAAPWPPASETTARIKSQKKPYSLQLWRINADLYICIYACLI